MRRDNLVEAVLAACRADLVLQGGGRLVVAFSGGPDSTALLHGLWRAAPALRLELFPVHVHHGMRAAADGDAEHAVRFGAELGLAVEVIKVQPAGRGEDAARRARHGALERAADRNACESIAVGHTLDDQAETVLLHLLRGSGVGGLGAMSVRDGRRFRPLLGIRRERVSLYCSRHGLSPVVDESNVDPAYTRNRVRAELLPLLERRFNPRVVEALSHLATAARQEHEVVTRVAESWRETWAGNIPRGAFLALPEAIQVEVLRRAWADGAGLETRPGGARRVSQALAMIRSGRVGMIQLGTGVELHADAEKVAIRSPGTARDAPAVIPTPSQNPQSAVLRSEDAPAT
ncbi:MAG: tRNA lysidine(34) synthetase TilS [Candidatus Dormibacteria bacterium]